MANGNFGGGNGSVAQPFLIQDGQDFVALRNNLTAFYKLANNIDMTGITYTTPSGNFTGGFDGSGYKISNLSLTVPNSVFPLPTTAIIANFSLQGSLTGSTASPSYSFLFTGTTSTSNTFSNIHLDLDVNMTFTNNSSTSTFSTISLSNSHTITDSSLVGTIRIHGSRNDFGSGNPTTFSAISTGTCTRCFSNINAHITATQQSGSGTVINGISNSTANDCYSSGTFRGHTVNGITFGVANRCYSNAIIYAGLAINGVSNGKPTDCFFLADRMYRSAGSSANLANYRIIGPSTMANCYALQGVQLLHEG